MRENLILRTSNELDSDYVLTVDDGTGTVFERLLPAGTTLENETVRLFNPGPGIYRVTMTVTDPTEQAYLTAQVADLTDAAQVMDVTAYFAKIERGGRGFHPCRERTAGVSLSL